MRKLALFTLASYLLLSFAAFSPLTFATDDPEFDSFIEGLGEDSRESSEEGEDMSEDDMSSYSPGVLESDDEEDLTWDQEESWQQGDVAYEINPTCNFGGFSYSYELDQEAKETKEEDEKLSTKTGEFQDFMNMSYKNSECGGINSFTKSFEKGDCTSEGMVITEISEVIGGDTEVLDSNGEYTNKVLTVYKGLCCLIPIRNYGEEIIGCKETRSIYKDTYQNCIDAPATHCEKRQWIMGTSGAGIIKVYVKQMYGWAAGIIGFIAVAVIVVSGIQITMSGVSGDITSAKDRIIQSISALVLLFLSGLLLYTINPTFFG